MFYKFGHETTTQFQIKRYIHTFSNHTNKVVQMNTHFCSISLNNKNSISMELSYLLNTKCIVNKIVNLLLVWFLV